MPWGAEAKRPQGMGIAIEGIIDRRWADDLDRFSGRDGVVNYWINRRGLGKAGERWMSVAEVRFIRRTFRQVDAFTGLKLVERSSWRSSDIDISKVADLRGSTVGLTVRRRSWFDVLWEDRRGGRLTLGERRTITHEIGHPLGLDHPYGNGFNRRYDTSDTIMSYNNSPNFSFTPSDVRALQSLWGAA